MTYMLNPLSPPNESLNLGMDSLEDARSNMLLVTSRKSSSKKDIMGLISYVSDKALRY